MQLPVQQSFNLSKSINYATQEARRAFTHRQSENSLHDWGPQEYSVSSIKLNDRSQGTVLSQSHQISKAIDLTNQGEPLFHRKAYDFPDSSSDPQISFDCSRHFASLAEVSMISPACDKSLNET